MESNRESKKKKIGSCVSRFGEETSEIWCLKVWGSRGATRKGVAACWFALFLKRGSVCDRLQEIVIDYTLSQSTGNRLQAIVINYKADVLL